MWPGSKSPSDTYDPFRPKSSKEVNVAEKAVKYNPRISDRECIAHLEKTVTI
jgi:hypothetical protein